MGLRAFPEHPEAAALTGQWEGPKGLGRGPAGSWKALGRELMVWGLGGTSQSRGLPALFLHLKKCQ